MPRVIEWAQWFGLVAALAHLWAIPEHLDEWWGYGLFFFIAASFQGGYTLALDSLHQRDWFLALGIAANLSLILLWLLSRTTGTPRPGPHSGHVEAVGIVDGGTAALELMLVAALAIACWRLTGRRHEPTHQNRTTAAHFTECENAT